MSSYLRHWTAYWAHIAFCLSAHCVNLFHFHRWGRWTDILSHGRFKRQLTEQDVETICRTILVYCLNHYRGDENIKSFIWDLITPTEDGQTRALVNHSGTLYVRKALPVKFHWRNLSCNRRQWLFSYLSKWQCTPLLASFWTSHAALQTRTNLQIVF